MQIELTKADIASALLIQNKKFEKVNQGHMRCCLHLLKSGHMILTDGYIMVVKALDVIPDTDLAIPFASLESFKSCAFVGVDTAANTIKGVGVTASFTPGLTIMQNWPKVISRESEPQFMQLSAKYVTMAEKIAALHGLGLEMYPGKYNVNLCFHPDKKAVNPTRLFGVVVPLSRAKNWLEPVVPDWIP